LNVAYLHPCELLIHHYKSSLYLRAFNAYQNMPRFEEPEFTTRNALIFTQYTGASPKEVALEITDPLETALQQLQEVKTISTTSSTGVSEINVEIKYEVSKTKEDLQIVWTKLRNKTNIPVNINLHINYRDVAFIELFPPIKVSTLHH